MITLLGIDYNSFSIDVSVWEDDDYQLNARVESEDLVELIGGYADLLRGFKATDVCIERLFLGPNAMTVKKLATVHGALTYKTLELGVNLHQVYVAHWHAKMLDRGNKSSKKEALAKANELVGEKGPFTDHNAADAYLIGLCWLRENVEQ